MVYNLENCATLVRFTRTFLMAMSIRYAVHIFFFNTLEPLGNTQILVPMSTCFVIQQRIIHATMSHVLIAITFMGILF